MKIRNKRAKSGTTKKMITIQIDAKNYASFPLSKRNSFQEHNRAFLEVLQVTDEENFKELMDKVVNYARSNDYDSIQITETSMDIYEWAIRYGFIMTGDIRSWDEDGKRYKALILQTNECHANSEEKRMS